jgi:predicted phosphodiesterase
MKTIIFSDVHLTKKFDPAKFEFLKKTIESVDQIVINGDFWDHYVTKFDTFVKSEWKRLFPMLRSKGTVYINGNHDPKKWTDDRVDLFCRLNVEKYSFKHNSNIFIVEHGNKIIPSIDEKAIARFSIRPISYMAAKTRNGLEKIGYVILGDKFFKIEKKANRKIKKYIQKNLQPNEILVTGHTHLAEFDLENRYINTGLVRHGFGQYVLIDDKQIKLITENY